MYTIICTTTPNNRAIIDNAFGLGSFINEAGQVEVLHSEQTIDAAKSFLKWRAHRYAAINAGFNLSDALTEIESGALTIAGVTVTIQPL